MPSAGEPVANPAMLHFTLTKPWEEPSSPEADRFLEVARRSPFAGEIAWKREFWRFVRKPVRRVRSALHRWTGLRR
jgi:lipopolysaccharide biosynthesis glycosyltransferase